MQIRLAPDDVAKLIGKHGQTVRSLRTILSAASMELRQRFKVEIRE